MEHKGADRRIQQRCTKNVSMTCSQLNHNDDHIVTVRNYSSRGMYFESHEAALIGSFIVLRVMAAHEMEAFASPTDNPSPFSMDSSDPQACEEFRSHTVAKVVRCSKLVEKATCFGIGATAMMLSNY